MNAVLILVACGGVLAGVIIALRALNQWRQSALQEYQGVGDGTVWPFLHRADYEGADAATQAES